MFATGENSFCSEGVVEEARVLNDLGGCVSVTTSAERVISFVIERNIEDGAEVEVEPKDAQQFAGDGAVALDEFGGVSVTKLVCVRRFVTDEFEARDASAFLIDSDDGRYVREVFQIVDEFPQLGGRFDVSSEKDESSGLNAPEGGGCFGVEGGSGHAGEEELTEGVVHVWVLLRVVLRGFGVDGKIARLSCHLNQ
jgi:hypothetical protein